MTDDRPLQHTQPGGNRSKIVFPDPPPSQDTATAGSETQAKGPRADPAESKKIFKADFKRQSDPGYYALPQENEQRKGIGDRKKKLGGRSTRPPSITAFAVHARDINAMALSPDDRAIDLTSIARVLHLIELKPWCR